MAGFSWFRRSGGKEGKAQRRRAACEEEVPGAATGCVLGDDDESACSAPTGRASASPAPRPSSMHRWPNSARALAASAGAARMSVKSAAMPISASSSGPARAVPAW